MFFSLKHKFKIWPRSKHTQSRVTKTCTGTNKKQKKQTTRCTKPAEAPTKKNSNFQELWVHFWVAAGFLFFVFFGACQCLVHLLFCFVIFGACQCFVKSGSPNLHWHQKKQTHKNFQELWVHFWVVAGFFLFLWCLSMFGASSGLFFVGARQCFVKSESPNLHRHPRKNKKTNHYMHQTCAGTKQNKQTKK